MTKPLDVRTLTWNERQHGHDAPDAPWLEWTLAFPSLETESLLLREPRPSDAPALRRHLATRAVGKLMHPPPDTAEGFQRFFGWSRREREAGRCFCFTIHLRSGAEPIGLVQVRSLDNEFGIAEWGFCLGASHWGTGLFIEAGRAVADFIFRHVGVRRLEARVLMANDRASGALMKLGATSEGILRNAFHRDGQRLDEVLWTIHRDDWLARQTRPAAELVPSQPEPTPDPGRPAPSRAEWSQASPRLDGTRGTLRELSVDDAPLLSKLLSAPAVARFIVVPANSEGFVQYIRWSGRQRENGRAVTLGIVPAGCHRAVGIFQLQALASGFDVAEWTFALGQPYWGSGLFLEGAGLLLQFAFEVVKVRRLEARVSAENDRACSALVKVGATQEGRLRRSFLVDDRLCDDILWSILDDEWRARKSRSAPGSELHPSPFA